MSGRAVVTVSLEGHYERFKFLLLSEQPQNTSAVEVCQILQNLVYNAVFLGIFCGHKEVSIYILLYLRERLASVLG